MKLFPNHWARPDHGVMFEVVPTPVGSGCCACSEKFHRDDQGLFLPHVPGDREPHVTELAWHRDCFLKALGI